MQNPVPHSSFHGAHVRRALVATGLSLVLTASFARVGTQNLHRLMQVALVLVAGASVAIADSLIKRSARTDTLWSALCSPTTLLAIGLYLTQIILVTYVFLKQWNLGVAGLMQMSVYAVVVVFVGITFFQEKVTRMEEIGMAFAFIGAILMNF